MKRIFSLILCVLMLVPCFAAIVSAEEVDDGYKNCALDNGIGTYASSQWNYDSNPKYINNDVLEDSYRFWRPEGVDRNPALDDRIQYCGLKSSTQYYEVKEVVLYVDKYGKADAHDGNPYDNNIHYIIEALVLGEWIKIGEAYNNDAQPVEGADRKAVATLKIDVEDVVTRDIRVNCTEWGRWRKSTEHLPEEERWHDWWLVPIVHEVQLWGVDAPPPPWDVPAGAVLSTNACLGGLIEATSTNDIQGIYAALAVDDKTMPDLATPKPYWQSAQIKKDATPTIWTIFDRPYDIVNVSANFGGSVDGVIMKYDIQILVNGAWESLVEGAEATSSVTPQDNVVYELPEKKNVEGVKFIFTEVTGGDRAILTEMGALIDSEYKVENESGEMVDANKCVFLKDYMTPNRKQSTGAGNLAILGTAYASSVMTYANASSIEYINDGGIAKNENKAWFAETFVKGTYCGVILKTYYNVDKVVLYFNDPITGDVNGEHVMSVDIQVKDTDGTFKTIKAGVTSYDQTKNEYVVSVQFDAPVRTNDIRIVYQSNGMVFPYIKELEVYSSEYMYMGYYGHALGPRTNKGKAPNAVEDFAARTLIPRSKYLDKISPIQYFEVTKNFDIKVLAWI